MSATDRAILLESQLDEMISQLPVYNSTPLRFEIGEAGRVLRGLNAQLCLSRWVNIPKVFIKPVQQFWGSVVENESSLPPENFVGLGYVAISAESPSLFSKGESGWEEIT